MNILFPANPIQPKSVERSFAAEAAAAKEAGFVIGRVGLEMVFGADVTIAGIEPHAETIYRGWLMKPELYRAIETALRTLHHNAFVPKSAHYKQAYLLPEWYGLLPEGATPRSIWMSPEADLSNLDAIAQRVASTFEGPVVIKDYVKSAKHRWFDACFIRDARDEDEVKRVTRNFLDTVREGLVGSIVFRQYVDFQRIGIHPKFHMPLVNEWRAFLCYGRVIYLAPYWASGDYGKGDKPDPAEVERIAAPLRDHQFYSVDIAQNAARGGWSIMEINPAGAAGVPDGGNVRDFYRALRASARS
jgi:hypothetical protein